MWGSWQAEKGHPWKLICLQEGEFVPIWEVFHVSCYIQTSCPCIKTNTQVGRSYWSGYNNAQEQCWWIYNSSSEEYCVRAQYNAVCIDAENGIAIYTWDHREAWEWIWSGLYKPCKGMRNGGCENLYTVVKGIGGIDVKVAMCTCSWDL
jgi:hypothetical protein